MKTMKTRNGNFAVRVLAIAVQGALATMIVSPAVYATDEAAALKRPDNTVEIGVAAVSKDSAKFGEYNGLDKSGASLIGNFNIRGGNAYDGSGVTRFEVGGKDLGTTSREFGASVSNQGQWNLKFGYNELRHNITDSYQTPYQEKMGGNTFTLPASFGYINTAGMTPIPAASLVTGGGPGGPVGTTTAAQQATVIANGNNWVAGTRNMTATQLNQFHTEDISSTRKNMSFAAGVNLDRQWSVQFDVNRLEQSGAKLQALPTQSYSTVPTPTFSSAVAGSGANLWKNQGSITAMAPTNYLTNTVNLALNWAGDQGRVNVAYYGSFFHDGYNSYSVMSPMANGTGSALVAGAGALLNQPALVSGCGAGVSCYPTNTMSTPPTNSLNQLNVSGGYDFSKTTKLAGGFSYGRNTQNDNFMNDPSSVLNTQGASLNGLVVTKNLNLKLTDQSIKDLTLTGAFKLNERDNRTSSNLYKFYNIGSSTASVIPAGTGSTSVVNTPYSNKKTQIELAGDYRLDKSQSVRVGYERENYKRWCDGVAANPNSGVASLASLSPAPAAGAECVLAPSSKEDKLNLGYKLKIGGDVSLGLGYAHNRRNADYVPTFYTPYVISGNEVVGFRPYFEASRKQDMLKANVSWQASERLTLSANGRFSKETYTDSALGDQDGKTNNLNLDATYGYSDTGSVSAYVSWQDKKRNGLLSNNGSKSPLATPLVAPTALWYNSQNDVDNAIGINFKQKGLMAGKLELLGDVSWSHNVTKQRVDDAGYNAAVRNATNLCALSNIALCGDYPDVDNKLVQLTLTGNYQVDKTSSVIVSYVYQKLDSTDYYFNGYQYGYTASAQLPTNQVAPNYSVNAVGVSYVYSFK